MAASAGGDRLPKLSWHKGRGLFYVTLGGRERYLSADKRKARREYDKLIAEWLAGGRVLRSSEGMTVAELIGQYKRHASTYYRHPDGSSTGEAELIRLACRALRRTFGTLPAAELRPLQLQALRGQWIAAGQTRTYINGQIGRIKRMYRWAVSQELVQVETFQALATVAGLKAGRSDAREPEPVEAVPDDVFRRTVERLGPIVGPMAMLHRLTGMRPGELCIMRPRDVDRSGAVWVYVPARHKNSWRGKPRRVYIGGDAQAALAPFLLREPESFCFDPSEATAKHYAERHAARVTPLSCGNRPGSNTIGRRKAKRKPGRRYTTGTYARVIYRECDRIDAEERELAEQEGRDVPADVRLFPRWSPNQLRHAAAVELQRLFGIEHAAAVLGNSVTVAERYARQNFALAERTAAAVSERRTAQAG